MQTNWFYTVWPFIGLGGAIVLVPILLMTDAFRGNTKVSRWWDPVWAQQRFAWVPQKRIELRRQAFDEARTALAMYEVDAIDVVLQSSKPKSGPTPYIMLRTETKVQMQKSLLVVEAFFPRQTFEAFSGALKCDVGLHNIPQREFAEKSAKALKLMATDTGLNPDD